MSYILKVIILIRKRINILLFVCIIINVILFCVLIKFSNSDYYHPTSLYLGVLKELPLLYWMGALSSIFFLLLLSYFRPINRIYYYLAFFYMYIYYFLLPILNIQLPLVGSSYYPFSLVKLIIQTGSMPTTESIPVTSYNLWPSFHFLNSFIILLTGSSIAEAVNISRYMIILLIFFSIIFFATYISKFENSHLLKFLLIGTTTLSGTFLFFLNYVPQSLAYCQYLFLIAITLSDRNKNKNAPEMALLFVIFSISLIITHFLSSLFILLGILVSNFDRALRKGPSILFAIMFLSWCVIHSSLFFRIGINSLIRQLNNFDSSTIVAKFSPITVYKYQTLHLSYLYIITLCILILMALIVSIKNDNIRRCYRPILFSFGLLPMILMKYSVGASESGIEMIDRVFLLGTPIMSILIFNFSTLIKEYDKVSIFNSNRFQLCVVILVIILISTSLFIRYPRTSFDQINPSDLAGARFLSDKMSQEDTYSLRNSQLLWFFELPYFPNKYTNNFDLYDLTAEKFNETVHKVTFIEVRSTDFYEYIFNYNIGYYSFIKYINLRNNIYNNTNSKLYF